ncbi:MAG: hypothetical protein IPI30_22320 [Saprospiraceae bacterium]|nr:hypothetical protein [Candidatus Vicinibacter affinis]
MNDILNSDPFECSNQHKEALAALCSQAEDLDDFTRLPPQSRASSVASLVQELHSQVRTAGIT